MGGGFLGPKRWKNVQEGYRAALAKEPGQRGDFLAEACANDPKLLSAVQELLDEDSTIRALTTATLRPVAAGTELGQYRVEGLIGQGGMGTVYRALDTKLHRRVAIKFLSEEL